MKPLVPLCLLVIALNACTAPTDSRWIRSSAGPEDLVVAPLASGSSIITGTARRSIFGTSENWQLQAFTPGHDGEFRTIFQGGEAHTFPFSPVGIALVENSNDPRWPGATLLYATNPARQTVEVFQIEQGVVVHRMALPSSQLLADSNGIAAFPDGSVYVTDFELLPPRKPEQPHKVSNHDGKTANTVMGYTPPRDLTGSGTWKVVAAGFHGCNGIAPGPAGKSLLVASLHSRMIWSIPRDSTTGELWKGGNLQSLKLSIPLHPDNLKRTGPEHYELAGARNRFASALHLLLGLPVCSGGYMTFDWDGKNLANVADRSELVKGHARCISTAYTFGDYLYGGQPVNSNVFSIRVP